MQNSARYAQRLEVKFIGYCKSLEMFVERGSFLLLHKNVLANAGTLHG